MSVLSLEKALRDLPHTQTILETILKGVSQEVAERATDGPDGWSVLFVACHVLDYETVFFDRIRWVVETDYPEFTFPNNDELIRDHDYAHQNLAVVLTQRAESRRALLAYIKDLSEEQLARKGVHPVLGDSTALELILNIVFHDVNHTEQIIKALNYYAEVRG